MADPNLAYMSWVDPRYMMQADQAPPPELAQQYAAALAQQPQAPPAYVPQAPMMPQIPPQMAPNVAPMSVPARNAPSRVAVAPPNIGPPMPKPTEQPPANSQQPPANSPAPQAQNSPQADAPGWQKFLGDLGKDPNAMAFLFALGSSLTNGPNRGSAAGNLTQGLSNGLSFMGMVAQSRQAREGQDAKLQQEQAQTAASTAQAAATTQNAATAAAAQKATEAYQKSDIQLKSQANDLRSRELNVSLGKLNEQKNLILQQIEASKAEAAGAAQKAKLETAKTLLSNSAEAFKALSNSGMVDPDQLPTLYENMLGKVSEQMRGMGIDVPAPAGPPAPPKIGDVVQGFRFKGGDPGVQTNWEKVQ